MNGTKVIRAFLVALIAALALLPAGIAHAAITVTTTEDTVPGSLRQAIADASPGETIVVPPGTYTLTSGQLLVAKSLTISGHAPGDTILSGGGSSRVFAVSGGGNQVTISGVTIRDGLVSVSAGTLGGGGLLNDDAELTLRDVVVERNRTDTGDGFARGGGIASDGVLRLLDSKVTSNVANAEGLGNVVAQGGGVYSNTSFSADGSVFEANVANAPGAGGFALGGGIYWEVDAPPASSLTATTIDGNVASGPEVSEGGGVLLVLSGAPPTSVTNTTITANTARLGRLANLGGGLGIIDNFGGTATVASSTLSANVIEGPPTATGGNLFAEAGTTTIGDTIVSGGVGPAGTENCGGSASSSGFNLDSLDECGFQTPGDQVNTDPLLGPLADNGGPARTMALASNSPAIDMGSAFGLTSDARGVPRPIDFPSIANAAGGDGSDIGAFELQPRSAITLGKLKRNERKGTAKLFVTVPLPGVGTLTLSGKGLKKKSSPVAASGRVGLAVVGKRTVRRALRLHGKRRVRLHVTYAPTGSSAVSQSRTAKLIRR